MSSGRLPQGILQTVGLSECGQCKDPTAASAEACPALGWAGAQGCVGPPSLWLDLQSPYRNTDSAAHPWVGLGLGGAGHLLRWVLPGDFRPR